jgi:hypothetical protein
VLHTTNNICLDALFLHLSFEAILATNPPQSCKLKVCSSIQHGDNFFCTFFELNSKGLAQKKLCYNYNNDEETCASKTVCFCFLQLLISRALELSCSRRQCLPEHDALPPCGRCRSCGSVARRRADCRGGRGEQPMQKGTRYANRQRFTSLQRRSNGSANPKGWTVNEIPTTVMIVLPID